MRAKFLQLEKWIRCLCGFLIFPALLIFSLCHAGLQTYNFTGLLGIQAYHTWILLSAACMLAWCIRSLWIAAAEDLLLASAKKKTIILLILFAVCTVGALFTPYIEGSFAAALHLLFAYAAFLFFNAVYLNILKGHAGYASCYFGMLFFVCLLCFTAGQISGLAELVYACMMSIQLTMLSI
ncbi:MAG: hypothetical protein LKF53_09500 [Solobacterium sp.]|jgi:hypothetical protein|nr:hypothetical protein [Solobacterium sp.]MCH4206604.1 hypothetical protein [Solobacterium sp.]MCH4227784.1 hypothetical protein [Solobacterium sp.]MCH4283324.1 hypothetical protein [Solobacterium sp.]